MGAGALGASVPTALQSVVDFAHADYWMGAVELIAAAAFAGVGLALWWRQDEVDDRLSVLGDVVVEDLDQILIHGIPYQAETVSASSSQHAQAVEVRTL